jgi:hypothetical protein
MPAMATQADVRRLALGLPATTEDPDRFRFLVDGRQFLWAWNERIDPKRSRIPNPDVIAVRVADELEKQTLLEIDPEVFFTEPHYDGYPAVLVRLPVISLDLLERVVTEAWRTRAPNRLRGLARTQTSDGGRG